MEKKVGEIDLGALSNQSLCPLLQGGISYIAK
jgi:hypothetical protein